MKVVRGVGDVRLGVTVLSLLDMTPTSAAHRDSIAYTFSETDLAEELCHRILARIGE